MLITQRKSLYFGNKMNISSSKIGPDFRNKMLHKFEVRKKSLKQKRASYIIIFKWRKYQKIPSIFDK